MPRSHRGSDSSESINRKIGLNYLTRIEPGCVSGSPRFPLVFNFLVLGLTQEKQSSWFEANKETRDSLCPCCESCDS